MKATIIDYGIGNIFSVSSAIKKVGHDSILTKNRSKILDSELVLLPGVGSFDKAMNKLSKFDLDHILLDYIKTGKKILGICVGMQLMLDVGEEGEETKGLSIFRGRVKKIKNENSVYPNLSIPHISWSKVQLNGEQKKFYEDFKKQNYMYFIHSYNCYLDNQNEISSYTYYGDLKLTASIQRDNVTGVQFHPERSGKQGLLFLKKYIES